LSDLPTERPFSSLPTPGGQPASDGDRARRAKQIADAFASRFPPTLPPPAADSVPSPGRHVRVSAETHGQLYVGGSSYVRDARARITARAGMPTGWSVRLTIVDARLVPLTPGTPASRADPAVLRAQRQMADPAAAAALAAPLRQAFAGRTVHADTHSLFVPSGLVFLRESSVIVPLPERASDDGALLARLCQAAMAADPSANEAPEASSEPAPGIRRGHLRLVQ
jgi:hypothetical protein